MPGAAGRCSVAATSPDRVRPCGSRWADFGERAAARAIPQRRPIFTELSGASWRISGMGVGEDGPSSLAARPSVAFLRATRSPRTIFWEAPDGGRQSNSPNRRADSMWFIQINIHPVRRLGELLHGSDWREWHSLFGRRPVRRSRSTRILAAARAFEAPDISLVVHDAKNASWVGKIELCPGSAP
jgi:hypothetical protein